MRPQAFAIFMTEFNDLSIIEEAFNKGGTGKTFPLCSAAKSVS
jgi:hypothetical protein